MKFQIGPWESFGEEILRLIEENLIAGRFKEPLKTIMSGKKNHKKSSSYHPHILAFLEDATLLNSIEFIPDFDLVVNSQCKYLQVTVSAYLNAYKVTGIATTFKLVSLFYTIS